MPTARASAKTEGHDWRFASRLAGAGVCAFGFLLIANTFSGLDAGRNVGDWFTFDRGLRRAVPATLLGIVLLLFPKCRPVWAWVLATVVTTVLLGALVARTVGTGSSVPGVYTSR